MYNPAAEIAEVVMRSRKGPRNIVSPRCGMQSRNAKGFQTRQSFLLCLHSSAPLECFLLYPTAITHLQQPLIPPVLTIVWAQPYILRELWMLGNFAWPERFPGRGTEHRRRRGSNENNFRCWRTSVSRRRTDQSTHERWTGWSRRRTFARIPRKYELIHLSRPAGRAHSGPRDFLARKQWR